jgi:lipopolysaccharide export system protein LptA
MAPTYPKSILAALAVAVLASVARAQSPAPTGAPAPAPTSQAAATHAATLIDKDQPVHLDASSSEVDYKTKKMVYKDIVISQGTMRVQADRAEATGLNFADSRWDFEGHVRIDAEPRGNLRSDSAVVEFRDNLISKATVVGKPADFEQKREGSTQIARGHADQIIYDVAEGTVRLTDNAWLSDGQNEISGPTLVYNIRAQRVQANGGASIAAGADGSSPDNRVHITIAPHTAKPDAGKTAPAAGDAGKPADPKP